jgi:hypothetical protein
MTHKNEVLDCLLEGWMLWRSSWRQRDKNVAIFFIKKYGIFSNCKFLQFFISDLWIWVRKWVRIRNELNAGSGFALKRRWKAWHPLEVLLNWSTAMRQYLSSERASKVGGQIKWMKKLNKNLCGPVPRNFIDVNIQFTHGSGTDDRW